MKEQWLRAAKRYRKSKKQGFRPGERKRSEANTLAEFLANGEGAAALKLLAESEEFICLGKSAESKSKRTVVLLDGNGLLTQVCVVGPGGISPDESSEPRKLDIAEAVELMQSFPAGNSFISDPQSEEGMVVYIRHVLDDIARKAL